MSTLLKRISEINLTPTTVPNDQARVQLYNIINTYKSIELVAGRSNISDVRYDAVDKSVLHAILEESKWEKALEQHMYKSVLDPLWTEF